MNWKQFLKPDWRKIVIFVILILFLPLVPRNVCLDSPCYYPFPLSTIFYEMFRKLIKYGTGVIVDPFVIFLYVILPLTFEYFLSCLIVWIYDKVKGKKPKK